MTTLMTLDETIKHYDEVAEAEERSAKLHQRPDRGVKGSGKRYLSCIECANDHRQLADWLRELKAYREAYEKIKKLPIRYNEVQGITRCLNIIEDCLGEDETDEASGNDR